VAAIEYCLEQRKSAANTCVVEIIPVSNRRRDSENVGQTSKSNRNQK